MDVRNDPEIKLPDLKDILPKARPEGGVHVSHDANGAVATMWMDPKPFDPMRVGDVNRHVTARFDENGKLQVSTRLSGGCFPHETPGAKTEDLVKLRQALLDKLMTMDCSCPEAKDIQKLADALQDQIVMQTATDVFKKPDRPEHPTPAKLVDW
jgi:hypothetical protein